MVLHETALSSYASPWVAVQLGRKERDLSAQTFDILKCTWEAKWHGASEGALESRPTRAAGSVHASGTGNRGRRRPTTEFWRRASLLRKMRSLIVRWQDSRRGVFYTKSGPCEDFADWPIPPYPEDYDWDDEI